MNINAMEDDSRARVPLEHTQTDADRREGGKNRNGEKKVGRAKANTLSVCRQVKRRSRGRARPVFITAAEGGMGKRIGFKLNQ